MATAPNPAMQHLVQARAAALENVTLYPQVMPPILGLVVDSDKPSLDMQRWVADFIAEALASPIVASEARQKMSLLVLTILRTFLESTEQDTRLLKSAIQGATSAYPLVFRHIIHHPEDKDTWQQLLAIKHHILRHMDSYAAGVRLCCVKFVQKVVQTQSPGVIADPRRPEQNEISLALVPRDHPLIPPSDMEAETSGLLDRILDIINDKTSGFLLLTATINSLGALVKSRASIAPRIINTVLQYDPVVMTPRPITTKVKIEMRSIERTIRALFMSLLKRQPNFPLRERMEMFMHRLTQSRVAILEESSKKRPAPSELVDSTDPVKRQRVDGEPAPSGAAPTLSVIPPTSISQLFSLHDDPSVQPFDVNLIPEDIVKRIIVPVLGGVDPMRLVAAVNVSIHLVPLMHDLTDHNQAVKARYDALMQAHAQAAAETANTVVPASALEEDDDYEPDYVPTEDTEQIRNRLEMDASDELGIGPPKPSQITLDTFHLPTPSPLKREGLEKLNASTIDQVFRLIDEQSSQAIKKERQGFGSPVASMDDRQSMIINFIRLLTRPSAGVSDVLATEIDSSATGGIPQHRLQAMKLQALADRGRQQLLHYILNDWTQRMDIATTWLTEEWYNDLVCTQAAKQDGEPVKRNFITWSHRFLDELSNYMSHEHQNLLIRFVSEVPGLDADILGKIKRLALDPERITMTVKAFHYLVMFRPPVRDICLDSVEDMWHNYDGAKASTVPILKKFRPAVLETIASEAS